jgi:hypothetical protein
VLDKRAEGSEECFLIATGKPLLRKASLFSSRCCGSKFAECSVSRENLSVVYSKLQKSFENNLSKFHASFPNPSEPLNHLSS